MRKCGTSPLKSINIKVNETSFFHCLFWATGLHQLYKINSFVLRVDSEFTKQLQMSNLIGV